MGHKDDERVIGEIFITEYNKVNCSRFTLDQNYLSARDENAFPDLKFCNGGELSVEVVRAVSPKMEIEKNNLGNSELIEVDPASELFIALDKKKSKHYAGARDLILLVHLPFYAEGADIRSLVNPVKARGYSFREIWTVWDDAEKKAIKLA